MRLKKRLIAAFMIILIVPFIIIAVTGVAIANTRGHLIESGRVEGENGEEIFYIVRESSEGEPVVSMPMFQTIFFLTGMIVLTALILVLWLYRSIIRPLNVLSRATKNMQEGNLDFTISGNPEDELGKLCEDFEEMRRRMKEEIDTRLKYESDMRELISNVSHDLKTPLTAIKGYSEGILDGVADTDEKKSRYVRTIYNKAVDMQVLVDELAFYTKIDSDIVPYNFRKIDIGEFFDDCVDELRLDTEVKNISFEYDNQAGTGNTVAADPEQLRRVVSNLVSNAVKYMDKPDGVIRISLSAETGGVGVSVSDNGSGIDAQDIPHIFDRFYRTDASRNSRTGGTGLGLAIAKKIISDHGGTINAESEKGKGTTIRFTLPFVAEDVGCEEIEDADYIAVPGKVKKGKESETNGKNTDNRG